MNKNNVIRWTIILGLWSVLLVPFFVASGMYFPYISGKNFAFRIIVEIIFALWVYLAVADAQYRPKFSWVAVSVGAFVLVMGVADIFAVNPAKALWSNYERMDGFITLAHLLMYLFVFGSMMKSKQNWLWFFRSSVVSSLLMSVYVLKEWLSTGATRVSVTLGNPIYVAVYFLFNLFFALMLWYYDVVEKNEKIEKPAKFIFGSWMTYVYFISAFICAFSIWRTGTRGVIIGLLGGLIIALLVFIVFEKQNKFVKRFAASGLCILALLVVGFFAVKNTQFVKNSPTLQRLAEISWNDVAGQGQARQYVWPMAIKGFLERPILGWGQDGFNVVFNKYYDPRMYSQEQWFDRAHNTPLDVLIAGGALGLIAYLSIFASAIYVLFKKRNNFSNIEIGLIIGLLAAYFAQNLFVFDNLISYVLFYVVLSYLYFRDEPEYVPKENEAVSDDILNYVIAPVLVAVALWTIWYCNVKPINANFNLISAVQTASKDPEASLAYYKQVIDANTFGNTEAREQLVTTAPSIAAASNLDSSARQQYVDYAYEQMQKQVSETPQDARYQYFMGIFLDNMGQYNLALPYLQKAMELSPKKITMMFELAKCYAYLGQSEKSLEVAKTAYDLVPDFNTAKMNYAAALILNNQEASAKQLLGSATTTSEAVVRMYLIRASTFIQKGDKTSAAAEVQKAINMVPGFKSQGESVIQGILDGTIK